MDEIKNRVSDPALANANSNMYIPAQASTPPVQAVDTEFIKKLTLELNKYKNGRASTDSRIKQSEEWWKLRNTSEEKKRTEQGKDGGFTSVSGWLHNVIVSKHADAMDAYPEPVILPREQGDKQEAKILSSIIPVILEQNRFEKYYSDVMWQKLKTGTGVWKVVWDSGKLNGLGDIAVSRTNLLNLYWEPGVEDIQDSKYMFEVSEQDKEQLIEVYPQLEGKLNNIGFTPTEFRKEEHDEPAKKVFVVECYYKKRVNGKRTLQYVKYVGDQVLYATENETAPPTTEVIDPATGVINVVPTGQSMAERGLYDHGLYPYVFDRLYPVEGSPCGYGYVDLCRNPQTAIDLLNTAIVKNAMVGVIPRFLSTDENNSINEDEFLDLSNPIIHIKGSINENVMLPVDHKQLSGVYLNAKDGIINELRETSGNTETATGSTNGGVTAASAIAALQEASGKGSRDSTQASYRAYSEVINLCIELVRQFYDLPRQFRIVGQYGAEQFISYDNSGIQMQPLGADFGLPEAYRLPVFDIKVATQKRNAFNKLAQNELALQFYDKGFFDPSRVDQALMCIGMMEFDGKDELTQKIAMNGTLFQKLILYMQVCVEFAMQYKPEMVEGISADIIQTTGEAAAAGVAGASNQIFSPASSIGGNNTQESARVANARANANNASQPTGGKLTARAGGNNG